jgi:hypothetical protein
MKIVTEFLDSNTGIVEKSTEEIEKIIKKNNCDLSFDIDSETDIKTLKFY